MARFLIFFIALFLYASVQAGEIYQRSTQADYETTYKKLYQSLEDNRFFVIEEINISKSLSGFAKKWGDDHNRNQLQNIRVMIICNGWYANQVSNLDTSLLALCPMRVTLIQKDKQVTALFAKPTAFSEGSKAHDTIKEVETTIIEAIDKALK